MEGTLKSKERKKSSNSKSQRSLICEGILAD